MGQEGVDFDKDIKPLLGNPAVISATDVGSFLSDADQAGFVAALQVKDKDALDSLIEKTGAKKDGEESGANRLHRPGHLVRRQGRRRRPGRLARAARRRAEARRRRRQPLRGRLHKGLEGLPSDALARVYVDVQGLLGQSDGPARAQDRVGRRPAQARPDDHRDRQAVDVDFNLHTDGADLTDDDLPLASGSEAAQVVQQPGEIGVGLRDPTQLVAFFESALQALDPQSYGNYEQGKRALSAKLDLDIDKDVIDQLTGNVSVSATIQGRFGARAEVKDPAAFARTVDKVAKALPQFGLGDKVTKRGDLYTLHSDGGGTTFVFGVVGDAFVVASDAARARGLAAAQPESVEGAKGRW